MQLLLSSACSTDRSGVLSPPLPWHFLPLSGLRPSHRQRHHRDFEAVSSIAVVRYAESKRFSKTKNMKSPLQKGPAVSSPVLSTTPLFIVRVRPDQCSSERRKPPRGLASQAHARALAGPVGSTPAKNAPFYGSKQRPLRKNQSGTNTRSAQRVASYLCSEGAQVTSGSGPRQKRYAVKKTCRVSRTRAGLGSEIFGADALLKRVFT